MIRMRCSTRSTTTTPSQPMPRIAHALLLAALFALQGCTHDHDDTATLAGDAHQQDRARRQLLLHGTASEWFIEHAPLVRGEEADWLVHLTRMSNGTPIDSAAVELTLDVGDGDPVQAQTERVRTGIYTARTTVPAADRAVLRLIVRAADITDTIETALEIHPSIADSHAGTPDRDDNLITFTREEAWKMDFRTEAVALSHMPFVIRTTGHLLTHPEMETVVPATTTGVLTFSARGIMTGRSVVRGEVLAMVSGAAMSQDNLEMRILDARAVFEKARRDYERVRTLHADSIVAERDLLEARLALDRARNVLTGLERDVSDGRKNLRAPQAGYVKRIIVENGAFVREGDPVLVIARNDCILLKAEVYQQDYARIASIKGARFRTATGELINIATLGGRLVSRGMSVDATAYSVPVYFELRGAQLVPGEFVDVFLELADTRETIAIPASALSEDLGSYYVYVQRGGESFEKREVHIEPGDGHRVAVLDGLGVGERIVTRGVHAVRLAGSASTVDAHAHAH